MNVDVEVLPVTPNEALQILGSLNMDEVEYILNGIRLLRSITKVQRDEAVARREIILLTGSPTSL